MSFGGGGVTFFEVGGVVEVGVGVEIEEVNDEDGHDIEVAVAEEVEMKAEWDGRFKGNKGEKGVDLSLEGDPRPDGWEKEEKQSREEVVEYESREEEATKEEKEEVGEDRCLIGVTRCKLRLDDECNWPLRKIREVKRKIRKGGGLASPTPKVTRGAACRPCP